MGQGEATSHCLLGSTPRNVDGSERSRPRTVLQTNHAPGALGHDLALDVAHDDVNIVHRRRDSYDRIGPKSCEGHPGASYDAV